MDIKQEMAEHRQWYLSTRQRTVPMGIHIAVGGGNKRSASALLYHTNGMLTHNRPSGEKHIKSPHHTVVAPLKGKNQLDDSTTAVAIRTMKIANKLNNKQTDDGAAVARKTYFALLLVVVESPFAQTMNKQDWRQRVVV